VSFETSQAAVMGFVAITAADYISSWLRLRPRRGQQKAMAEQTPTSPPRQHQRDWDRLAAEAAAVNLIALLEQRGCRAVWKRRDGEKATFHVPWRMDRHPSLGVFRRGDTWFWVDHARNEAGTPIQAIERLDGVSRKDAILRLTGHTVPGPPARPVAAHSAAGDNVASQTRAARKAQAQALYALARAALTPSKQAQIDAYWRQHGVVPPPDLGAGWIQLDDGQGHQRPYVVIPLPNARRVWAVECRLLDGQGPADRLLRARTFGPKELWVCWREDRRRVLVAESILDALSAVALWPDWPDSLVALNGVGNVRLLPTLVEQANHAGQPVDVIRLALDADPAGRQATEQAKQLLTPLGVRVEEEDAHVKSGVKDLNKLLQLQQQGALT
jgi:hypothetical protein